MLARHADVDRLQGARRRASAPTHDLQRGQGHSSRSSNGVKVNSSAQAIDGTSMRLLGKNTTVSESCFYIAMMP